MLRLITNAVAGESLVLRLFTSNTTPVYNFTDLGLPELFNDSAIYALYMAPAGTSSGTPWANIQLVNG